MDLSGTFRALRERWWIPLVAMLLAGLVTFIITPERPAAAATTSFRATATLLQGENQQGYANQTQLERVALFATTGEIPRLVAETLDYSGDPAVLAAQITPEVSGVVGTVRLSSTGTNGPRTAEVVNAFADQTVEYFAAQAIERRTAELTALEERLVEVSGLVAEAEDRVAQDPDDALLNAELNAQQQRYTQIYTELQDAQAQATQYADLVILERATPIPVSASGGFVAPTSRWARVGLAAGLGLVLGLILALVIERANARIRSRDDVISTFGVPVIAEVPKMPKKESRQTDIAVVSRPLLSIADAYRNARSAILLTPGAPSRTGRVARRTRDLVPSTDGAPGVVLVTSGHAKEGKSTTVANLAASLAETGRTVLVIDADFRAPRMNEYFDVPAGIGLSNFLTDPTNLSLDRLARPTNVEGVRLLEAGTERSHPAVLASQLGPVIEAARSMADIVLVDSAPVLHANDTFDIAPLVDRVILVVRSGRLTMAAGQRVSDFLNRLQAPIVGVVLVGAAGAVRPDYGYGTSAAAGSTKRSWSRRGTSKAVKPEESPEPAGPEWLQLAEAETLPLAKSSPGASKPLRPRTPPSEGAD